MTMKGKAQSSEIIVPCTVCGKELKRIHDTGNSICYSCKKEKVRKRNVKRTEKKKSEVKDEAAP